MILCPQIMHHLCLVLLKAWLSRDYTIVCSGTGITGHAELPQSQRAAGDEIIEILPAETGISTATEMSMTDINELEKEAAIIATLKDQLANKNSTLEEEFKHIKHGYQVLEQERDVLRCKLISSSTSMRDVLHQSPAKVKYLTGLPSMASLITVYNLVGSTVPDCLNKFDQFRLTLMKLRLKLGDQDLAIRFNISQSSVSR